MSNNYRTVAKFTNQHDAFLDILEQVNEDLEDSDFSILYVIDGDTYLVKEDKEDGDVALVGELSDDDALDYWADTDEFAQDLGDSSYKVGEFPFGDRAVFSFPE